MLRRISHLHRAALAIRFVDQEPKQRPPTKERQSDKRDQTKLLHAQLSLFADGDAPSDTEIPNAISEVITGGEDSDEIKREENVVIRSEVVLPSVIKNRLGGPFEVFHYRRTRNVINQEKKEENAGPALERVHAVLAPAVLFVEQIRLRPACDKESVNGVKQQRQPDDQHFHGEQNVLGDSFKKLDDAVKPFGPGEGERVQGEVLHHVKTDGDDSGKGMDFMEQVILARDRESHF